MSEIVFAITGLVGLAISAFAGGLLGRWLSRVVGDRARTVEVKSPSGKVYKISVSDHMSQAQLEEARNTFRTIKRETDSRALQHQ